MPFSRVGAELRFEVVSRASERTNLMVTTNLPCEKWAEVLGYERMAGARLDRLTHKVRIIEANGESFRRKRARKQIPAVKQQTRCQRLNGRASAKSAGQ